MIFHDLIYKPIQDVYAVSKIYTLSIKILFIDLTTSLLYNYLSHFYSLVVIPRNCDSYCKIVIATYSAISRVFNTKTAKS